MSTSSSVDSKTTIPKLTRETYPLWRSRMQALLRIKGYWNVVSGQRKKEEGKTDETFDDLSEMAASYIYLQFNEEMERLVVDKLESGDAAAMWTTLETECLSKRAGARFNAYDDLFSIRKTEDESLHSLALRVADSVRTIRNLRPKEYTIAMMEEELECMALIRALPEDYKTFSSSLTMMGDLKKETLPL